MNRSFAVFYSLGYYGDTEDAPSNQHCDIFIDTSSLHCYLFRGTDSRWDRASRSSTNTSSFLEPKNTAYHAAIYSGLHGMLPHSNLDKGR